jgi:hypothetical protein
MKQNRTALLLSLAALSLPGCYVLPVGPDGQPGVYLPIGAPSAPAGLPGGGIVPGQPARPQVLHARLYPANELATQTGMVSGTVTNMNTGKGRFQLQYGGEMLTGEATRVSGDERKGVASAYGPTGAFMSCEYQMNSPVQGAGKCSFSSGALYQVHIGN